MAQADPQPNFLTRDGRLNVARVGLRRRPVQDLYYALLRISWPSFVSVVALSYLVLNLVFAWLYWQDMDGIVGVRRDSFADALFFSVETFATIGFGRYAPYSEYVHWVVSFESFCAVLAIALLTGLTFAKFSRSTARVMFSERAVIGRFDGQRCLMFRIANERTSHIIELRVRLTMARDFVSAEGHQMRRVYDLQLQRNWTPLFALTWTVFHPLDTDSPLCDLSPAALAAVRAEFLVTVIGTDETFNEVVHARYVYRAADLVWGARFVNILEEHEGARR
ncbi:MAG: ion channel, partial [Polyangiales bacterium]